MSETCLQHEADLSELQRQREELLKALESTREIVRTAQVEAGDHRDRCRGLAQLEKDAATCLEAVRAALRAIGKTP